MTDLQSSDWADILAWRKRERQRLIEARKALPLEFREQAARVIIERLDRICAPREGKAISLFWPFRGEPDLRPWMDRIIERGGRVLLPVVIEKGNPLTFRPWVPGAPLEKGIWNIPVPATRETAVPDICIAPVVGFDEGSYRLGYGGGYFDRTLAQFFSAPLPGNGVARKPLVIGIGYAMQRIDTIHPLPHDIAMDRIVTEG